MKFNGIPFYYYPTTILLIDDNEHFLESISFKLDNKLAYRSYDKPFQALQFLKEDYSFVETAGYKLIENIKKSFALTDDDQIRNSEKFYHHLYEPKRFNEISMVLVDYSMPSMTGIDFCRQIKDLSIKKIFVTGEAEDDLAVKAFNEGIINKFIRKDNYRFVEEINSMIAELQWEYFRELSVPMGNLVTKNSEFINDFAFEEYFKQVCDEQNITEFYLISESCYLLLDMDAQSYWLNVKTSKNDKSLELIEMEDVQLYQSKVLKGKEIYYCELMRRNLGGNRINSEKVISYRNYIGL